MTEQERKEIIEIIKNYFTMCDDCDMRCESFEPMPEIKAIMDKYISILERDRAGWKSVKDEVPNDGDYIICLHENGGYSALWYDENDSIFMFENEHFSPVKYWMEPPEAPKEASK